MGGGTRINWAASFKLPPHVRKEWAEEHGVSDFNGPRFDRAMDAVCDRVGVTSGVPLRVTVAVEAVAKNTTVISAHAPRCSCRLQQVECYGIFSVLG